MLTFRSDGVDRASGVLRCVSALVRRCGKLRTDSVAVDLKDLSREVGGEWQRERRHEDETEDFAKAQVLAIYGIVTAVQTKTKTKASAEQNKHASHSSLASIEWLPVVSWGEAV